MFTRVLNTPLISQQQTIFSEKRRYPSASRFLLLQVYKVLLQPAIFQKKFLETALDLNYSKHILFVIKVRFFQNLP